MGGVELVLCACVKNVDFHVDKGGSLLSPLKVYQISPNFSSI